MTNYRRNLLNGGTYFFTVAILNRHLDLLARHISLLKAAIADEKKLAPFFNLGFVILPDHLHALWRLPEGDADYSNRWRRIKAKFSKNIPRGESISTSRNAKSERGLWQRRFWEHTIRDEEDLNRHLDYIHYNPVKHGLVSRVVDWPHSTFHEYAARGKYSMNWGNGVEINGDFGE
ncbi:MAG: transposase [Proteobacteria bacterium]|nr:transposase [Pseudomonadota bacterium]MBU4469090.1 transposase [Pseudomonadota bacterium]MCG2751062.1 transposase [Desulfobacteraceae bacterium]